MDILLQLKRFNPDTLDIEQALALLVFARGLRQAHEEFKIEVPEWLDDRIRTLNREVTNKTRDALEMRLKELRQAETQLMTPAEKREKIKTEREQLERQLGVGTAEPAKV